MTVRRACEVVFSSTYGSDAEAAALGALVRARRRELGLTQRQVAQAVDATQTWVSRLERGVTAAPRLRLLRRLAVVLKLDFSVLLGVQAAPIANEPMTLDSALRGRSGSRPRP